MPFQKHRIKTIALVTALLIIFLMPFANKAFHVDDILFLYSARNITHDPLRPYGSTINWSGSEEPLWSANRNPPASSYILSLFVKIFSEREIPLHISYMIFPIMCVWALYYLADSFIKNRALASFFLFASPGFFVSSTNLMCDIPQLAFYLTALMFYILGFEKDKRFFFILAGIFTGLAILTKYTAISIFFVFLAYNTIFKKSHRMSWLSLVIPLVMLTFWSLFDAYSIGRPHFFTIFLKDENCSFFWQVKAPLIFLSVQLGEFLIFLSACSPVIVFSNFAMLRDKKNKFLLSWLIILSISAGLTVVIKRYFAYVESASAFALVFLFLTLSISFLRNCISYLVRHVNDKRFLFLFTWFLISSGVAVFNYVIAARFILPVLPALVLLIIYLVEANNASGRLFGKVSYIAYLAVFALTLLVAYSDYCLANSYRNFSKAARKTFSEKRIFFLGHWGFQYYMEREGFKALNFGNVSIRKGDMIIVPVSNFRTVPDELMKLIKLHILCLDRKKGMFTIMYPNKAGFYCHQYGPLPYWPGAEFAERYEIYEVEH